MTTNATPSKRTAPCLCRHRPRHIMIMAVKAAGVTNELVRTNPHENFCRRISLATSSVTTTAAPSKTMTLVERGS
jgi:hypothetical protein